jgi:ribosomal protein S18 acetylase RimI-like enzyme
VSRPTADVSVRVAWPDDAGAMAHVQVRAWRLRYSDVLPPDTLASLDPRAFAEQWQTSLSRSQDARQRVLVALDRNNVRGFAVTGPSDDPDSDPVADAEISEFVIDPDAVSSGHGSRLLQACVDTMRQDRFSRGTVWLTATDDSARRFLVEAGWSTDGAHRELDLDGDGTVLVKQIRLHTDVTADD